MNTANGKIIALVTLLLAPITCLACTKMFKGDDFLLRAHNKGISPNSTCYTTDLPKNSFYAFPTKKCVVTFDSKDWLVKGWKFMNIEGKGRFTASKTKGVIKISIEKRGGFTLKTVTVSNDLDSEQCSEINLADVL